jgi:hypothetical protein
VLAEALQHSTPDVRVSAQETLAKLLGQESSDVRFKAAISLAAISDKRAIPVLLDAIQGTDQDMQLAAVKALVQSDPLGVLELVLDALRDRDKAIAWTTARLTKGIPKHIFLSYSRQDTEIMHHIRNDFQSKSLIIWTDENLEKGTPSWKFAIENAIETAGCMVSIFSPDAKKSEWVRAELDHAAMHKVRIFPILALGDESNAIPFGFGSNQWTDIRQVDKYASEIEQLINAIYKHLGR